MSSRSISISIIIVTVASLLSAVQSVVGTDPVPEIDVATSALVTMKLEIFGNFFLFQSSDIAYVSQISLNVLM